MIGDVIGAALAFPGSLTGNGEISNGCHTCETLSLYSSPSLHTRTTETPTPSAGVAVILVIMLLLLRDDSWSLSADRS